MQAARLLAGGGRAPTAQPGLEQQQQFRSPGRALRWLPGSNEVETGAEHSAGLGAASAAFSMPCPNRHGFDSSCPSGRQGMLSSSGVGKEGVIGAMGPRLHFKASDCNHREQMRKRRSKLCTEHRPCSPSSVSTCSSCLPCSPSACPSSRRTKR